MLKRMAQSLALLEPHWAAILSLYNTVVDKFKHEDELVTASRKSCADFRDENPIQGMFEQQVENRNDKADEIGSVEQTPASSWDAVEHRLQDEKEERDLIPGFRAEDVRPTPEDRAEDLVREDMGDKVEEIEDIDERDP